MNGKQDAFGVLLREQLPEFLRKKTLLQSMGQSIGVLMARMPICH